MSGTDRNAFSSFVDRWTETNQKILKEMTDFSLTAAAEGLRVAGDVQTAMAESARRLQESTLEVAGRIRDEVSKATA